MLIGYIRNGVYCRVLSYDENPSSESSAPGQTLHGTSRDYKPGDIEFNSRASYDRRDTPEQTKVIFERDSARMRGDLDAAARAEHVYNASKREQYQKDPLMRQKMLEEWPHEPERNLRLPLIR